jgi:hypothetical protein
MTSSAGQNLTAKEPALATRVTLSHTGGEFDPITELIRILDADERG